jgi:4-amino-4-deoxy-L-arabinose transferase-like glycosyltransferase
VRKNKENQKRRMSKISRFMLHVLHNKTIVSLALFILALIPRLLDLNQFLTADEFLWVDRSRNFLAGLTNPAYRCTTVVETWEVAEGLACTLRTGHPGVTTMWTGSAGFILRWLLDGRPTSLHDYVVAVSTNPLDPTFITPERLGTVLITSLWVVAVYWLARRLFGPAVALVGAVLIALDPFHIALSRVIHHDALSTTFMTLSVLMALIYWGQKAGRKWLLASGVLAGLAFISKLASLFLMPFIALTGLWFFIARWRSAEAGGPSDDRQSSLISQFSFLILAGLLWFTASVVIIVVVWPAIWVIPVETIQTAFSLGFKYSTGGHAKGNFLLGQVSQDPGVLFYPVTWLFRTSPLVMLGVGGVLVAWLGRIKQPGQAMANPDSANKQIVKQRDETLSPLLERFYRYLPLMLIFISGYFIMLVIAEKKQERYLLPIYPWVDLIAGAGLLAMSNYHLSLNNGRLRDYVSRFTLHASRFSLLLLIVLGVNGILVAANYPYYFTYYNPLLGGARAAEKAITIGWGEGLDLAAGYLNQKKDHDQMRVASWYQSTFAPYYEGTAISYSQEKGKTLAGDYVIFYINQTQRRFPDEVMFDYFESRFQPETTIRLKGLDYAWIYPSLGVDHYIQDQTYTGIASLLAWQWTEGDQPLIPGQPAEFELYWEYLGKAPEERFFFRLVDAQGRAWAEGLSQLVTAENPPIEQWREGEIIYEQGPLIPPVDIPPGQYRLEIGFYTRAPAVTEGELRFIVPEPEASIIVTHAKPQPQYTLPAAATPIAQNLGQDLTLLGAILPAEPVSLTDSIPLELFWRVRQPLPANLELHVGLMDEAGEARQAWFNLTLAETFNPAATTWQPGDIIHTSWQFDLLPEVQPGRYHFELILAEDTGQVVRTGSLTVGGK